ncbi:MULTISPECIES: porin [unclassified Brenneria]|uniref:porin n=1 Tax=unclassified Brenneria TaxID=2634434 RepID=UPI0029C2EC10|nr:MULTISPECIES: porin [unclassified Brenneria]MDX5626584.1 porin [Brenneria sp. L3-3Z]MDX5694066.1 porin [Brenneria sp. L4-2C]
MMKRNILAVVIPALLAAGAANAAEVYNKDGNKLDVYGRAEARYEFVDQDNGDGNSDKTRARLGVRGETQITDQLTGYGRYELQFGATKDDHNGVDTRLAFAGLKFADYGSLDFGRNAGILRGAIDYTDILPNYSGDFGGTDHFLTDRSSGVLTYRNTDFFGLVDGLNFGLQYAEKDEVGADVTENHGDGWGTSVSYDSDIGLGVIATYASVDRASHTQGGVSGQKADTIIGGVKYDANSVYLAAIYGQSRNLAAYSGVWADKTKFFEVSAAYNFDFGLTPSIIYSQAKADNDTAQIDDYSSKYVALSADYAFNKNINTYAVYKINLLDSDNKHGVSDDDAVFVGLKYQF